MIDLDEYVLNFEFKNDSQLDLKLCIEPHFLIFNLVKDALYLIRVSGPAPIKRAYPRFELLTDQISFYVWPGAGFEIYENGKLITLPLTKCIREPLPHGWNSAEN